MIHDPMYDQAHYLWAMKQLTLDGGSGWGIHASSDLSIEFLTMAEKISTGIEPVFGHVGEVMKFNSELNCFTSLGVSYCASIGNDRTNHICHLLVPVERSLKNPEELFCRIDYVTEEVDQTELEKLVPETDMRERDYQEVLEKYGLKGDSSAKNKFAKLLFLYYQAVRQNKEKIQISLGDSYKGIGEYLTAVHEIMWLLHMLSGDNFAWRKKLSYSVYANSPGVAFQFSDAAENVDLFLDREFTDVVSKNMPENRMFLQLAEYAQESPEKFYENFIELIQMLEDSESKELAFACLRKLLKTDNDEALKTYVLERALVKNWAGEPYRILYLENEAKHIHEISEEQAVEDLKLLFQCMGLSDAVVRLQHFIVELINYFKNKNSYRYVTRILSVVKNQNDRVYGEMLEGLCNCPSDNCLLTWHIGYVNQLPMEKRIDYLKKLMELYQPVHDKLMNEKDFFQGLLESLKVLYEAPEIERKSISEFVLKDLCQDSDKSTELSEAWDSFIEKKTEEKLESDDNYLERCLKSEPDVDPYSLYPVFVEALEKMRDCYKGKKDPEPWLSVERIDTLISNMKIRNEKKKNKIGTLKKEVDKAKKEKLVQDLKDEINGTDSIEALLNLFSNKIYNNLPDDSDETKEKIEKEWVNRLAHCIEEKGFNKKNLVEIVNKLLLIRKKIVYGHFEFEKCLNDFNDRLINEPNFSGLSLTEKIIVIPRVSAIYDKNEISTRMEADFLEQLSTDDFIELLKETKRQDLESHLSFWMKYENNENNKSGDSNELVQFYQQACTISIVKDWMKESPENAELKRIQDRFKACVILTKLKDCFGKNEMKLSSLYPESPDWIKDYFGKDMEHLADMASQGGFFADYVKKEAGIFQNMVENKEIICSKLFFAEDDLDNENTKKQGSEISKKHPKNIDRIEKNIEELKKNVAKLEKEIENLKEKIAKANKEIEICNNEKMNLIKEEQEKRKSDNQKNTDLSQLMIDILKQMQNVKPCVKPYVKKMNTLVTSKKNSIAHNQEENEEKNHNRNDAGRERKSNNENQPASKESTNNQNRDGDNLPLYFDNKHPQKNSDSENYDNPDTGNYSSSGQEETDEFV